MHYNISKPSLSTHFTVLKDARLIQADRKGNHIYYRLNATVADEVIAGVMDMMGISAADKAIDDSESVNPSEGEDLANDEAQGDSLITEMPKNEGPTHE